MSRPSRKQDSPRQSPRNQGNSPRSFGRSSSESARPYGRGSSESPRPFSRGFSSESTKGAPRFRPEKGEARLNRHAEEAFGQDLPQLDEDDLASLISQSDEALVLILDQVQDPRNVGACLRSAAAAGALAVVAPKHQQAPLNEAARRISCGGAEQVPFVQVSNLVRALEKFQKAGLWVVGTSDRAEKTIYELDLKGKIGLALGSEEDGLRRLTTEHCDFLAKIPMLGKIPCLNVSVAAGVCLFEAVRQRTVS